MLTTHHVKIVTILDGGPRPAGDKCQRSPVSRKGRGVSERVQRRRPARVGGESRGPWRERRGRSRREEEGWRAIGAEQQRRIRGFRATGETRYLPEVSWGCRYIQKYNIECERVNLSSEPDFYWRNSPVNFKGQNPNGESFPTFPSG